VNLKKRIAELLNSGQNFFLLKLIGRELIDQLVESATNQIHEFLQVIYVRSGSCTLIFCFDLLHFGVVFKLIVNCI